MKKTTLYKIVGLPPKYAQCSLQVSDNMHKNLVQMCKTLPKYPVKLFVQGEIGGLVNMLVNILSIKNIVGIDFKKTFVDIFNKENSTNVPFNKIVILYGVGEEQAVSSAFPTQVLKGLLSTLEEHNCKVFVQSPLTYSKFLGKYGIPFVNTLNLPKTKEEKIC